jgi:hypothetical protein
MMIFLALLMFVLFLALIRRLVVSLMGSVAIVLADIGSPLLSKQAKAFLLSDSNDRYCGHRGLKCFPLAKMFNLFDSDSQYPSMY